MFRLLARVSVAAAFFVGVSGASVPFASAASSAEAGMASGLRMSLSPSTGTYNTAFDVRSVDPCPAAPNRDYQGDNVHLLVFDEPGQHVYFDSSAHQSAIWLNPDRSWSTKIVFTDALPRNGRYWVAAVCTDVGNPNDGGMYAVYEPVPLKIDNDRNSHGVVPLYGSDRIGTAIAISKDAYADGGAGGVVLTRSDSFADSLAGTPLAIDTDGPLLLTPSSSLDDRTKAEIDRVLGGSGTVYVLGGAAAVSDAVVDALSGYDVVRLAGSNRFATAVAIANEIGEPSTLLLADGDDFHDGLVAGAAARAASNPGTAPPASDNSGAVLLTDGSSMPPETQAYLDGHPNATRFAIGQAAATAAPSAAAIAGPDPASTSVLVANRFFPSPLTVAVASMTTFPDGLAGGVHAAAFDAPLLFTTTSGPPPPVRDYLRQNSGTLVIGFLYGGTAAVGPTSEGMIDAAMRGDTSS